MGNDGPGADLVSEEGATGFELAATPVVRGRMHTGNAGTEAAWFHLMREAQNLPVIARFTILGEPVSKARARFTRKGSKTSVYTPERTTDAEKRVAAMFRQAAGPWKPDAEWTYGVVALFFNGTRQRRDVDNMLKLVLDGLNGVAWADDNQVVEVSGRKSYENGRHPRTEVLVYRLGQVHVNTRDCAECGRPFVTYQSTKSQRYCSGICGQMARRRARMRTCEQCGVEYDSGKVNLDRRYCSKECKTAAGRAIVTCTHCGQQFTKQRCHVRATNYCTSECAVAAATRRRSQRPAPASCQTCGGPLSKKTYKQCRVCVTRGADVSGAPKPAPAATDRGEVDPCPSPNAATPAEE